MDEGRQITGELRVRHGRTEYPFVSLRRDLLRGPCHHDLRRLRLGSNLRRGKARRAADAANEDRYVVARCQTLSDVDGFFRLAGVVRVDHFNLFAANATGRILLLDGKIDRFLLGGARGSGVAGERSKYSDLDRVG